VLLLTDSRLSESFRTTSADQLFDSSSNSSWSYVCDLDGVWQDGGDLDVSSMRRLCDVQGSQSEVGTKVDCQRGTTMQNNHFDVKTTAIQLNVEPASRQRVDQFAASTTTPPEMTSSSRLTSHPQVHACSPKQYQSSAMTSPQGSLLDSTGRGERDYKIKGKIAFSICRKTMENCKHSTCS